MQDCGTVFRIDTRALKVMDIWPVASCEQPSSMDMERRTDRVFIGCRSGVMTVLDGKTGRVVDMQPIGRGVDATEFDPERHLVFLSTGGGEGALSIFHEDSPDKYTRIEDAKTQTGARTMALDRKTGKVYLSVAKFGPAPQAAPGKQAGRGVMVPGSFSVLILGQ